MLINKLPPTNFLKECFSYCPDSGELRWNKRPENHFGSRKEFIRWNSRYSNKIAGTLHNKRRYIFVKLNGFDYGAHQIIWKIFTNSDAFSIIDHVDGDGTNNRFCNLRKCSAMQNSQNKATNRRGGMKGVRQRGKKWAAQIQVNKKKLWLGTFHSEAEAHAEYKKAAIQYFGDFACVRN